jgi:hypothetical protein
MATNKSKRKGTDGADSNPLSRDRGLKAMLKPLLPAGTVLSPLTLEGAFHPSYMKGGDVPQGLAVRKGTVPLGFTKQTQEVFFVRLDTLSALVPEKSANAIVTRVQPTLREHGYQALVTTHGHLDFCYIFNTGIRPANEKYGGKALLVFFKAPEPWPLLFARGTNGTNLGEGLGMDDIVRRLKRWAGECDLAVLGAGFDWVELRFRSLPKDVARFAGDLYLFGMDGFDRDVDGVPDDVWQRKPEDQDVLAAQIGQAYGIRTAADLKPYLGPGKRLFLWWD